jgi:hypothetical protein
MQTIEVEDGRLIAYEEWVTFAAGRSFSCMAPRAAG